MASLKVAVRVRPFNQREIDMGAKDIVHMDGKKTRLQKPKLSAIRDSRDNYNDFTFDYSYWSFDTNDKHFVTQDQVYDDLGTDVIDCAFQGYNACVFAYGQTGSGKTFTMMGTSESQGLIPRICRAMFTKMKLGQESGTGYKTSVSYLEIYNERVKDLLGPPSAIHGLRVREHRTLGPYVEELSQHPVSDYDEIQACINKGNSIRTTASTNMNDTSSRSHAIFTITFVQAVFLGDMPSETVSKIHLVDLAGSERADATGATGQRLKEGAHINKSLVTLGSVISALAEQSNPSQNKRILYIPYRDSVLTWLLKDSLGGNSKTIMIAAISPADCNYGETLSTLRYANRAKNIINKPTINEDPNVKLIRELREEIMKLKHMLMTNSVDLTKNTNISNNNNNNINVNAINDPSSKMLEDLLKKEAQAKVLTEEWTEKWREAQSILREEKALGLRKSGVGVVLDSDSPHLIGIHDDISTGVTLYSLKEGKTNVGTSDSEQIQDIVLDGIGIQSEHCCIELVNNTATIIPMKNSLCWINAIQIDEPTIISQGDILLLGRTNMFRYNNPVQAAKLRKLGSSRSKMDLSRLSLIASSRENLSNSLFCYSDDEIAYALPSSTKRHYYPSEQFSRDDPELQDEHRKILQTIDKALSQLNIERDQMHEQYKSKVHKLSNELINLEQSQCDKMAILNCRERELFAKKEMIIWEKSSAKTQIDIVLMQISALQTQLDSKKRDFYEYVVKELQELQDCDKIDQMTLNLSSRSLPEDSSDILLEISRSLDSYSSQFIRDTITRNREDINRLENELKNKENLLGESSKNLVTLDDQLIQIENDKENLILERSQAEYEIMKLKKQTLSLNIKQTVDSDCQTDTIDLSNKNQLETLETCDTFHTANSNCSTTYSTPSCMLKSTSNDIMLHSNSVMSDSGVCLSTNLIASTPNQINFNENYTNPNTNTSNTNNSNNKVITYSPPLSSSSSPERMHRQKPISSSRSTSSEESLSLSSKSADKKSIKTMNKLRQKIAILKAHIMKNLELNCDKNELDEKISQLQDLQKHYFQLEQELDENCRQIVSSTAVPDNGNNHSDYCLSDSSELGLHTSPSTSSSQNNDESQMTNTNLSGNHHSLYAASIARTIPISTGIYHNSEFCISIPSYITRGAGKQTHFEYEVVISLTDNKWTLLRRYRQFRELHLLLKNYYGSKIAEIPFPRRKIFSKNSDDLARDRRRQLETYLRRLLVVCSKIPQSPIYEGSGGLGLSKCTLIELSPSFFKKGLFESGKHGTG